MATNIPGGKSTVTPSVAVKGASKFLDSSSKRSRGPRTCAFPTRMAPEVTIGDSVFTEFDAHPEWSDTPSVLSVYVDAAAATMARPQESFNQEMLKTRR